MRCFVAALALLGTGARFAGAQSAVPPITIQRDASLQGDLRYRIISSSGVTPVQQLPAPQADGVTSVPVPRSVARGGLWIEVFYLHDNRCARLQVPPVATAREADNILQNGDFRDGLTRWQMELRGPRGVRASIQIPRQIDPPPGTGGRVARCEIAATGTEDWHIQLLQKELPIIDDRTYVLAFSARASRNREIRVGCSVDISDWHPVGLSTSVALTTEWKRYTLPFTARETVAGHGRLEINLGAASGWVDIAAVSLRAAGAETPGTVRPSIRLSQAEFRYAQTVFVPVKYHGRDVHGVRVSLRSGAGSVTQCLIGSRDRGMAQFHRVPIGVPLEITATSGRHSHLYRRTVVPGRLERVEEIDLPAEWAGVSTLPVPGEIMAARTAPQPPPTGKKRTSIAAATRPQPARGAPGQNATPAATQTAAAPHAERQNAQGNALPAVPENALASRPAPSVQVQQITAEVASRPARSAGSLEMIVISLLGLVVIAVSIFWMADSGRLNGPLARVGIQVRPVGLDPGAVGSVSAGALTLHPRGRSPLHASGRGLLEAPQLVGIKGTYVGSIFAVAPTGAQIGRDPSSDIALVQDSAVSRRHARIQAQEGRFMLVDDGSSNGTYHNGVRVSQGTVRNLLPGDELSFGASAFRFEA